MPTSGFAIYDRPDGRHRHGVRVLAVLLLGATLVLSSLEIGRAHVCTPVTQ